MIILTELGVATLSARFKAETRAFQVEQRKQMRVTANIVKKDVEAKVAELFPASTVAHKRTGATMLGPLRKKIRTRVFFTTSNVIALIRPAASAFYGRFQETGLNVIRKRKAGSGSHPFRLPRKPFLEPVAESAAGKVTEILGDSYRVFYSGGAA